MTFSTMDCLHGVKVRAFSRPGNHAGNTKMQNLARCLGGKILPHGVQEDCDLAIVWGLRNEEVIQRQIAAEKPYIVMERGYFGDRSTHSSVMFNGMHGRGQKLPPGEAPRPEPTLEPWRDGVGAHVLLVGQVPGDMSLEGLDIDAWYREVIDHIHFWRPGKRISFRCHPLYPCDPPDGVDVWHYADPAHEQGLTVEQAIHGIGAAFMYSSTFGVELMARGVQCNVASPMSMIWSCCSATQRSTWARWLSYCQWNDTELADGTCAEYVVENYEYAKP